MTYKTHIAGGIAAAEITCVFIPAFTASPIGQFVTIVATAALGALMPDLDHRDGKLTKSNPVTRILSKIFTHRGVLHTPVFWLLISLLLLWAGLGTAFAGYGTCILIGIMAGILSHIMLDTLNPGGIMWLWPIGRKKMRIARIKVGSSAETTCAYILYAMDVILFLYILIFRFVVT